MTLLRKCAKQGYEVAQFNLGKCYLGGIGGVAVNPKKAIMWYQKSAKQEYPSAQAALFQYYYLNGELLKKGGAERIITCARKAAEGGIAEAQFNLGSFYRRGEIVEKDYKEAKKWYEKAAAQNFAEAQHSLGHLYLEGLGVEIDNNEAAIWFHKAAKQGVAESQHGLGDYYSREVKDFKEANKWYTKAALQGIVEAQFNVGNYYQSGKYEKRDFSIAIYWFTLAAKQNLKEAQESIPMAQYLLGLNFIGLGDDNASSYWLKQAESQGMEAAKGLLTEIKKGLFAPTREIFLNMLDASQEGSELKLSFFG